MSKFAIIISLALFLAGAQGQALPSQQLETPLLEEVQQVNHLLLFGCAIFVVYDARSPISSQAFAIQSLHAPHVHKSKFLQVPHFKLSCKQFLAPNSSMIRFVLQQALFAPTSYLLDIKDVVGPTIS